MAINFVNKSHGSYYFGISVFNSKGQVLIEISHFFSYCAHIFPTHTARHTHTLIYTQVRPIIMFQFAFVSTAVEFRWADCRRRRRRWRRRRSTCFGNLAFIANGRHHSTTVILPTRPLSLPHPLSFWPSDIFTENGGISAPDAFYKSTQISQKRHWMTKQQTTKLCKKKIQQIEWGILMGSTTR